MAGNRGKTMRLRRWEKRRMYGRRKYCTGCGRLFAYTHWLLNHRYTFRCGGMFRIRDELTGIPHVPLVPPEMESIRQRVRRRHKGRIPGTVRPSRMPGGSGFRNHIQEENGYAHPMYLRRNLP
jgi:hypothetical protein